MPYNGSEVPEDQNRQAIHLAQMGQKWVFRHWLDVAPK